MLKIVLLYLTAVTYAAVRYVVFSPNNLDNFPVFVTNKGISMAAALCLALAFWHQWRACQDIRETRAAAWFRAGIFGAVVHVPLSLSILRPSYFKEFFKGDYLSFNGELIVLFGGLTAGGIYLLNRSHWSAKQRWWLSLVTVTTLFSHTLCMGIARGLNINSSHGYLPPMWLLSLVGVALGAGFLLMSYPQSNKNSDPNETAV